MKIKPLMFCGGFLTIFLPEDAAGAPMTCMGMTHIVLAGLSSLATMVSMLLLGLWFRGDQSIKGCRGCW